MDIERFLASDCGVRGQRGGVVRQTGIFRHRLGPSSPGLVTSPVSADLAWPQMRTIVLLGSSQHPLRRKSSPERIRKMSICSVVSMARSASSSRDESFKRLQRLFCGYSRFPSWRRAHKRRQEHGFQRRRPAPCNRCNHRAVEWDLPASLGSAERVATLLLPRPEQVAASCFQLAATWVHGPEAEADFPQSAWETTWPSSAAVS